MLRKVLVGSVFTKDGKHIIVYYLCMSDKCFEHIFFECKFSPSIWSIFFGKPLIWNHKPGLSWDEILASFIEEFDLNMNHFWFTLTNEILWFI